MPVPNTFANATATIPLSQLDANFNTTITLGNTAIQLGNTVSTLNNMTLANVTISTGNVTLTNATVTTANVTTANIATEIVTTSQTLSYGAANGVVYLNGSKVATSGSGLVFDGTNLGVGVTPSYKLDASAGSSGSGVVNTFRLQNVGTTVGDGAKILFTAGTSTDGAGIASTGVALNSADLRFYTGGNNERARFNAGAPILCLSGGNTSATGTGIAFPATQSASSDANTLDDYEEGTFTPTLSFGGGSTGLTYVSQGGFYTKIGNQVTVNVTISLSNKGSSTGLAVISGLPFTVSATSLNNPVSIVQGDYITFGTGYLAYYAPNNGTTFNPYLVSSGNVGNHLTNTAFANNTTLRATFSYFV